MSDRSATVGAFCRAANVSPLLPWLFLRRVAGRYELVGRQAAGVETFSKKKRIDCGQEAISEFLRRQRWQDE